MSDNERAKARAVRAMLDFRNAAASGEDILDPLNRFERELDEVNAETREVLETAMAELEDLQADVAFQRFAEVTNEFLSLREGFRLGERMAEVGQDDLFFPSAATHLAQVAGFLKELKNAAERVKDGIDNLEAAFEKKDVETLIEEAKGIEETLTGLLEDFEVLRDELP